MSVITISRQMASLGDEISVKIAEKLGFRFVGKKEIESKIVELGFPKNKLHKFDECKIGFFTSLTRSRDEYLNYLQTAILEYVSESNCVILGRGSFIILKDLPNHVSCRFIADDKMRIERVKSECSCGEKTAVKKIQESDIRRRGFHKSFFNFDIDDPAMFHLIVNTGLIDVDSIVEAIVYLVKKRTNEEIEKESATKIEELLIGQRIVNMLVFDYNLNINFLRASINGKKMTLHGVAESSAIVDRALVIVSCELPDYEISSAMSVVQDFKAYNR